ncbi:MULTISPECIES: hypothetical protein [Flavobacterium]|uniref:DUF3575 domain-containing protein n=2 Tax=Flavobacterium TaxID=237 RepID=A0A2N9PA68_9FLAO|nr:MULTISPECIES: hypothetical protein [Flavobacterium]QYS89980.1 hypothetical protein JJC05_07610 [Flavobacterium davisii]RVU91130.1 hypothetical protein EH230_09585 [Flavobacterium columnare]SPE77213.1 hypothetical protein FLACOL_01205 [Flavobacterium columnare]
MLYKRILFIIFLSFLSHYCNAQDPIIPNSDKKYRFIFQMDNRLSSLRDNQISILGAKIGFQYKNKFRFGVGTSFILSPVKITYINKRTQLINDNKVSLWYGSLFTDWIFYKNPKWECFLTEQIGFGKPSFVREINDDIVRNTNISLYVNEISGQANYKILKWIGLGAGIGYRNILNSKAALKTTFDAPIYIGKIILYPENIF